LSGIVPVIVSGWIKGVVMISFFDFSKRGWSIHFNTEEEFEWLLCQLLGNGWFSMVLSVKVDSRGVDLPGSLRDGGNCIYWNGAHGSLILDRVYQTGAYLLAYSSYTTQLKHKPRVDLSFKTVQRKLGVYSQWLTGGRHEVVFRD